MIDPLAGLLWFCGLAVFLVAVFWPGWGLRARWSNSRRLRRHVLVEDTLKHLFDCEYKGRTATAESLAGAVGISAGQAAEYLAHLEAMGFARSTKAGVVLTESGRSDALRVIRIHRLWEQYFAEETGLDQLDWHDEADRREHTVSADEVERLAERLGHPRYDPHGDPIPTMDGEIAPPRGQPLSTLKAGAAAVVVHVEDEPATVYAQLVAENLGPGLTIRVLENSPQRVRFESAGAEYVLAPVVAANLTVLPLAEEEAPEPEAARLSRLRPGERAKVIGILPACRGMQRRRLLDLGFVPGTDVEAELESSGGDPVAYRIRGTLIALRRAQAELIVITGEDAA